MESVFRDEWPGSAELYLPVPAAGSLFRNRDLAASWRRVLEEAGGGGRERQIDAARDAFYRGFVADAIASFVAETEAMDSSGERHRGLLTGDDPASWQASVEPPVSLDYHGWRVFKTGPWGQGPVFLQQLRLLSQFELGSLGRESADFVHVVVECAKLAFADREAWYGDPASFEVPLDDLLSPGYAEERDRLVGEEASAELRPGSPGGREPRLPRIPAAPPVAPGTGEPTRSDTCHIDVDVARVAPCRLSGSGRYGRRGWDPRQPRLAAARAPRAQLGRRLLADEPVPLLRVARAQQIVQRHLEGGGVAVPRLAVSERELRALDHDVDEVGALPPERTELELGEQPELLQEDRPLAPRPGLEHPPAVVVQRDGRFDRRLPRRGVVAGQQPAVPLAGAVHRLRLRDERRDRVRDEAAVERVACGVDLPFAAAPARLPGRRRRAPRPGRRGRAGSALPRRGRSCAARRPGARTRP